MDAFTVGETNGTHKLLNFSHQTRENRTKLQTIHSLIYFHNRITRLMLDRLAGENGGCAGIIQCIYNLLWINERNLVKRSVVTVFQIKKWKSYLQISRSFKFLLQGPFNLSFSTAKFIFFERIVNTGLLNHEIAVYYTECREKLVIIVDCLKIHHYTQKTLTKISKVYYHIVAK